MTMNCPNCAKANLRKEKTQIPGEMKGERFSVSMEGLVCPRCGWKTVAGKDMADYMRRLADAYRAAHLLLTSEEIRQRRSRLGMNQEEFARYLGVGVASVRRWEMGKVQDVSSNELIKLRTDEADARLNLDRVRRMRRRASGRPLLPGTDPELRAIYLRGLHASLNLYWQPRTSPVRVGGGERRIALPLQLVPASLSAGSTRRF